ncbi:MAG: Cys-every-fifth RiPP peptide CefA [Trichodesmium sp. MAG_R01]|nr:Cys-every-fifth RiPP peptide CefA [Trichodesmium sp. MAG_R01]
MKYIVQPVLRGSAFTPGTLPDASNKIYVIAAGHSGKVISVRNGEVVVEQQTWSEEPRQQWKIEPLSGENNGYFRIVSVHSGNVLDVPGSSQDDGTQIIEHPWHGGDNQQWAVEKLGNSRFRIVSRLNGKVLDVYGSSNDQGASIIQWPWGETLNQQWRFSILTDPKTAFAYDARTTIYEHSNYGGSSQTLGVGSYDISRLTIGNDKLSSLRVPEGLRVTLYQHPNFRGETRSFTSDTSWVGDDFNDQTSAILVEKVVSVYQNSNYEGSCQYLGIGCHNVADLQVGNDVISSLKVPQGLMAILYEHANFTGRYRIFTESTGWVGDDLNDLASSIVVKAVGVEIPIGTLKYGDKVVLRSYHGKYLVAESDGSLNANHDNIGSWEQFTITRSGKSRYQNYVCYGDTISLQSAHNKYLVAEENGQANANGDAIGSWEQWTILRSGNSLSQVFVTAGDIVSLKSAHNKYLVAEENGQANANSDAIGSQERWTIRTPSLAMGSHNSHGGGGSALAICGAEACASNVCGAEACGADACVAAACGAAATLIGTCGVAAAVLAVCGADVCGVAACVAEAGGAAICGAAVGGFSACGADACVAAACGAAACGAAACGAAACGADFGAIGVCGAEACGAQADIFSASGADACAAEATIFDGCGADACLANTCAINLCPADACAVDACAIDIIPIIPGI